MSPHHPQDNGHGLSSGPSSRFLLASSLLACAASHPSSPSPRPRCLHLNCLLRPITSVQSSVPLLHHSSHLARPFSSLLPARAAGQTSVPSTTFSLDVTLSGGPFRYPRQTCGALFMPLVHVQIHLSKSKPHWAGTAFVHDYQLLDYELLVNQDKDVTVHPHTPVHSPGPGAVSTL